MSIARSDELTSLTGPESSASLHLNYRPDIDGLRAVAVLAVVVFHASPRLLPGGFVGVDVFFVISGFLISGIIFRDLERGKFSCLDFYIRRVRRIFPALIVVLSVVATFGWLLLLPYEYQRLGKHLVAGAGFVSNLVLYADYNLYFGWITASSPLLHLWSLGVEEQFYLFWPIFLLLTWRFGKAFFVLVAALVTTSFILNVSAISSEPIASFYLPSSRLWQLGIGGALAWAQLNARQSLERIDAAFSACTPRRFRLSGCHVQGALGATLLFLSCVCMNWQLAFPGWWALAPSFGALLLLSAGPSSWVNRHVLMHRAMVYIGLVSYPLYLWHWPVFSFLHEVSWGDVTATMITGALLLSLALAALTYKYVEVPLRFSRRRGPQLAVMLCIGMLASGVLGGLIFMKEVPTRALPDDVSQYVRTLREPAVYPPTGTVNGFPMYGTGQKRVLFIGDSTLEHYIPRIAKIVTDNPQNSHSAVFALSGGCSVAYEMAFVLPDYCKKVMESALGYAKSFDVETIVIGASWYFQFVEFSDWTRIGEPGRLKSGTDRALQKIKRTIADFVARGKRVYLLLPSPVSLDYDPHRVITRSILPPGFRMEPRSPARAEIVAAVNPITTKLRNAAREAGAIAIDPMDWLCDSVACPGVTSTGKPMYVDAVHLHPTYVRDHVLFMDEILLAPEKLGRRSAR